MNVTEWEPVIRDALDVAIIYSYILATFVIMKIVQTFVSSYTDIKVAKLTGKEKKEEKPKESLIKRIIKRLRRKNEYD